MPLLHVSTVLKHMLLKTDDCEHRINKKTDWIKCSNCCNSKSTTEKNAARTHKAADNLCPFFIR